MRRIAIRTAAIVAVAWTLSGCRSIDTPWDRMRRLAASQKPATPVEPAEEDEAAEARPKDRKTSDPVMIPQQVRGGYGDSPSSP